MKIKLLIASCLVAANAAAIDMGHLYLIGAATPAGWPSTPTLPEEMISIGNDCFLWDGYMTEGDFKFLNTAGDWGSSIVATEHEQEVESGRKYAIVDNTGGGSNPDHKFKNGLAGNVRIVVDLRNMTMTFKRPALSITGDAAHGWSNTNVIPIFADDQGNIEWTGLLQRGQMKFLAGSDWWPGYCAPNENEEFSPGYHGIEYRTGDHDASGNWVDHKFVVPRAGRYTLKVSISENWVTVARDDGPMLIGGFTSQPGRYVVGYRRGRDRAGDQGGVYCGPVPRQLWLRDLDGNTWQLHGADGHFSGKARLRSDQYYKLYYNLDDLENSCYSPSYDVNIGDGPVRNVAPMQGYSYTVNNPGVYDVTADFNGATPTIEARWDFSSGINDASAQGGVSVWSEGRVIVVEGAAGPIMVADLSGRVVSTGARTAVTSGVYIVSADGQTFKIYVK